MTFLSAQTNIFLLEVHFLNLHSTMKFTVFLNLLVVFLTVEAKFYNRIRKVECGASLNTLSDPYCFLKSFNRNQPVANFGAFIKRKVPNGKVNWKIWTTKRYNWSFYQVFLAIYRKNQNNEYQKTLYFPDIEGCKIIEGSKSLPIFEMIMNEFRKYVDDLDNICSKIGQIGVFNVSFSESGFAEKFPSGNYQIIARAFDDYDENIYNFSITAITSH